MSCCRAICSSLMNTQIDVTGKNIDWISSALDEDLVNTSDWKSTNKLCLNSRKREQIIICSRKKLKQIDPADPSLNLGNNAIRRVKVTNSLGLMMDGMSKSI